MPTANPQSLIRGQWNAHVGARRKIFASFDEAVAWINANGGTVVITDETRRFI